MSAQSSRQKGFVLVLTLWMLAIITIAAGYLADRVMHAMELAQGAQKNTQVLLDLSETRAEILFRLGTTNLSLYGLGRGPDDSVALDNRPYRGVGGTIVRLQDNRGLLNLNIVSNDRLHRFLGILDVPADQRGVLMDTLHDYMDADSLKRLNGAEAPEYAAAGLPPPRNERLSTPFEPRRILAWRGLNQLWDNDRLPSLSTTSYSVALNPNTAPWEVLATLPGMTNEVARNIIVQRKLIPFASPDLFAQLSGIPPALLFLQIIMLPSDAVRVTQSAPGLSWALQYNVSLTPNEGNGPWRIDYFYKTRLTYKDDKVKDIPELPKRSTLPATLSAPFLPPT